LIEQLRAENPNISVSEMARRLSSQFGTNDSAAYGWIYSYLHPVSGAAPKPAVTLDTIALKKKFYEDQLKALTKEDKS
jgi:hypothetical protein